MSKQFINFNGELFPSDHPVMTISNRSFKYGDGLFESMRYVKGELKFVELHADRLRKGMKILKLDGYSQVDSYFINEKVEELIRRNKIGPNARVRFTVFRNADGFYNPTANKMGYTLEVSKLPEPAYAANSKGLIIDVFDEVPKPVNILSNLKTNNSLVYVLAGVFKNQHQLDEVLILNQNGFLCESMSSNVFVVYEKHLYTPSLSEGCIAGVMRKVVMRLAKENNLKITEAQINPEILNQAEEVFLTNASSGIQWVMGYNKKRYFNETSRFLLNKLNEL
ncbi:aminotransferase class IV [Daejeonella oryzae]|uniref:aminotransferase class IV n=1 Tax=Daejeonella oryzae TaxID=1122943 RepID=UPI0004208E27|nr:aminotransferase class IV [Daejeonella oryzae]